MLSVSVVVFIKKIGGIIYGTTYVFICCLKAAESTLGFSVQLHLPPPALAFLVNGTVVVIGNHGVKIRYGLA
jgi:hypothetical protein